MRPLTIITGIVLGSAFSIAFGLAVVRLLFFLIGDDQPGVASEHAALHVSIALFSVLTAIAAVSFWALVKNRRWRYGAQAALWLCVVAIGRFYWP